MAFYYGIHNVAQYLMSAFGGKADIAQEDVMECLDIGPCPVATILGIIDDGDVRQAVRPGKLRNNPAVPSWHSFLSGY